METWKSSGGGFLVCCGTLESDWDRVLEIKRDYDAVIPSFGVHPWHVETLSDSWEKRLESYLQLIPAGIGEIGLDFTDRSPSQEVQESVFRIQLAMAKGLGLPVSIHIRKAWESFIGILKELGPLPGGGLIHSFSGSADMVPLFERYNLYISFSGSLTNPSSKKVHRALQAVSFNRILLETDSPDLLPKSCSCSVDGVNTPENLIAIAHAAAGILKKTPQDIVQQTLDNGIELFGSIITHV